MSTDLNVHCVTCNDTHRFDDANHQDDLMSLLIKHADAIASLGPLLEADRSIELRTMWGRIDADWFARHKGHKLVPIDEYGRLLTQCHERIACTECGSNHRRCTLDLDHEGPHR